ncbi:hypothetical protein Deipr_1945 [Deinococcus proteolyticus MRP]|uniref:Uncharacterized protein n=1 Tax=Deinococcus proteolyticus (strain ATCC 35074 / DSM 20540 / JCM 6276 / NBRC 101906 / NCIMB 13154 / VKM Ac-1939 / CCM 2703 / MRP) TaxID=693977 RepID=F0RMD9_DEIPM|nr:hypothetical protein Deipr_1945 [Deinococcus proteolyticus MRP]
MVEGRKLKRSQWRGLLALYIPQDTPWGPHV